MINSAKRMFTWSTLSFVLLFFLMAGSATASGSNGDTPLITVLDTILYENFSGTEGPFVNYPIPGWTVSDSGVPEWDETSWNLYDPPEVYEPYWNGNLARVFFDGPGAIADWIISPAFDCSGETTVTFSFKHRHSNRTTDDNDTVFVFGSIDDGLNWTDTIFWSDTSMGDYMEPDTQIVDISSWAAGQSNVKIAFCFRGNNILTWHIDEPFVGGDVTDTLLYEDFNGPWGPFGDNPPAGWTIVNEVTPGPADGNDWSRYYYSTWVDTTARVNHTPDENQKEWLITPSFEIDNALLCSLSFYVNYWDDDYTDTDTAFVLGSTDGGLTWPESLAVYTGEDEGGSNHSEAYRAYDMSWANGESNVKIGFKYVGLGGWWWIIDDVMVAKTILYTDNIEASSFDYPTEFIEVSQDYNSQVSVRNMCSEQQTFDVNLIIKDPGDIEVYNQTETDIVLESLEPTQVTFTTAFTPISEGNYTFTAVIVNPGDENAVDDTVAVEVTSYAHQSIGGPDTYGYYYIDNAGEGRQDFIWIDISGTGTQIEPTLHYFMSDPIEIGFGFEFYGQTYDYMWVNSHGSVHIGERDVWLMENDCPLPDTSSPHAPMAMVFWDRLKIQYEIGQGVYYQNFDTADVEFTVVQWKASVDNELDDSLEFEVIIYEDGSLLYQYNYMPVNTPSGQGQFATIGIEYDSIPSGLSYLCDDDNPTNRLEGGLAIKWYKYLPGFEYLPGDANMYNGAWPPVVIGGDVTYLVNYFRGITASHPCLLDGFWASADINGDCNIIGSDVTKLVSYFRGIGEIQYCPEYEPTWPTPGDLPAEAPSGWPNCE